MRQGRLPHMLRMSLLTQGAVSALSLLLLLTVSLADEDHNVARRLRESGQIVPIEQILQTLSRARPDVRPFHVLESTLQDKQDHLVYSVEYLDTQGVVWTRQYDATSGALLHTREGE